MSKFIKHTKKLDKKGFKMATVPVLSRFKDKEKKKESTIGFRAIDSTFIASETDVSKALDDLMSLHKYFKEVKGNNLWDPALKTETELQWKMLEYINEHGLPFAREFSPSTSMPMKDFWDFVCNIAETMNLGYENKINQMYKREGFLDAHFVLHPIWVNEDSNSTLSMEFKAQTLRDALIGEVWERAKAISRYRTCPVCEEIFECKKRQDQKFCSNACRQKDFRDKNKELKNRRGK